MSVTRSVQYLPLALLVGAAALLAASASALPPAYGPGGYPNDPFGDVTGPNGQPDGVVNALDAIMVQSYVASPGLLSPAQQSRVRRYGDVSGVANFTTVGNSVLDTQDSYRHVLLQGGLIDAGTAGPTHPEYGDVNGDGASDMVDAVLVHRAVRGLGAPSGLQASVNARGLGDISPTVPNIDFGDGVIDGDDVAVITARSAGTEASPPAYVDYLPLHVPTCDCGGIVRDEYVMTDVNGQSGDAMHQIHYVVDNIQESKGYTVIEVKGDDNSLAGFYKGIDGSLYLRHIQYPVLFNNRRLDFQTPVKLLDAGKVAAGNQYSGKVWSSSVDLGWRPTPYTVTVRGNGDVTTPAAGNYPGDVPASTWSKTVQMRLDIALLAGPTSNLEMQQAFFYDFTPFIGLVQRGQAPIRGSAAPDNTRPFVVLDSVKVRGLTYRQFSP